MRFRWLMALLLAPVLAGAQEIQVDAVGVDVDHELVGHLGGGRFTFSTSAGAGGLRLGFEWLAGRHDRNAVVCGGFIPTGPSCPQEPARDNTTFGGASLGINFPALVSKGRVSLAFTPAVAVMHIRTLTRGLSTGNRLEASKTLAGPIVDLSARLVPSRFAGVAIVVTGGAGIMIAGSETVTDSYLPFDGGFLMKDVSLGVALRY